MLRLADYAVDPTVGFLPPTPPLQRLPGDYAVWEQIAANVPALLMTGKLRSILATMPELPIDKLMGERQLQRAMLLLSVFGNGYVWGGESPAMTLPRSVAVPWWQVAEKLGRPAILSHASMVLQNWRLLDESQPIALDNLDTLQLFLGGLDERWFYLTTVAIEAEGAPAMPALVTAQAGVAQGNLDLVGAALQQIALAVTDAYDILLRIPEQCAPYIFYHRVRPFVTGWPEPGVIYEGVSPEPQRFAGGSAAQSSLLQALDAGLGVVHVDEKSRPFLLEMRDYMPPLHRTFIEALAEGPSVRAFVLAQQPQLTAAYNHCIDLLDRFRKKHLEIAVRYISHQAANAAEALGTGGTSFVPFLSTARQETSAQRVENQPRKRQNRRKGT